MDILQGSSVLVTGGTGSFGRCMVAYLLAKTETRRVIVYSRDELKQYRMREDKKYNDPRIRFFLGDVRDQERMARAFDGVDYVVHAAALKQVPVAEYNPFEAIQTNVLGAHNVIECAINKGVHRDFHFARRIRAFITPTRLSARQISSSHVASLPVEAALDVEPTRAPAFRASLRHRSTPMLFLRQADFVALRPGVSRPAPVAPRSSAACRRTAAGSDALLPAGASSTAHASPGGLRFSPAAAEDS